MNLNVRRLPKLGFALDCAPEPHESLHLAWHLSFYSLPTPTTIPLLKEGEGRIALEEFSKDLTTLEELLTRSQATLKLEPASLEL